MGHRLPGQTVSWQSAGTPGLNRERRWQRRKSFYHVGNSSICYSLQRKHGQNSPVPIPVWLEISLRGSHALSVLASTRSVSHISILMCIMVTPLCMRNGRGRAARSQNIQPWEVCSTNKKLGDTFENLNINWETEIKKKCNLWGHFLVIEVSKQTVIIYCLLFLFKTHSRGVGGGFMLKLGSTMLFNPTHFAQLMNILI